MSSEPLRPLPGDVVRLVAPLAVLSALFALRGRPAGALGALVAGVVLANAVALRPALPAAVQRGQDRAVHGLGRGFFAVLGCAAFLVIVLPVWLFRSARRTPFHSANGWNALPPMPASATESKRPYGALEPHRTSGSGRPALAFAAIGLVAIVLLADTGAGLLWGKAFPTAPDESARPYSHTLGGPSDEPDRRADGSAMRDAPWRAAYFAELQALEYTYWPYLLQRPKPFDGRFINLDGWERTTWSAGGSSDGRPVVWLLGGSVVWGEGQRDEHTIASEVARLAAADDLPIEARNFGQRDWVSFQEVGLYRELLSDPRNPAPDLALFVDGADDVAAQAQELPAANGEPLAVPMHFGIAHAQALTRPSPPPATPAPTNALGGAWSAYVRTSLAAKAIRGVHGLVAGEPAGAAPSSVCAQECLAVWGVPDIGRSAVDKAVRVYRQNRTMARDLSQGRKTVSRFFWQPVSIDIPGYRTAPASVGAPLIDLTGTLDDHQDDYLDPVHTNEDGAYRMAVAIYERIRPDLIDWYRTHGGAP